MTNKIIEISKSFKKIQKILRRLQKSWNTNLDVYQDFSKDPDILSTILNEDWLECSELLMERWYA